MEQDLHLIANHAHQLREISKRVDLEQAAKRFDAGERTSMVTSDEQAAQCAALLRATSRFLAEVELALHGGG